MMFRRILLTAAFLYILTAKCGAQTYYMLSQLTNGAYGVPWPMNPCASCPVYPQGNNIYLVDDHSAGSSSTSASMMTSDSTTNYDITPPPDGGDTNGTSTNYVPEVFSPDNSYMTNGSLWIEAWSNDTQNIYLQLHNTTNTLFYQLWSTTNVASPSTNWIPGEFLQGHNDTNVTRFINSVPMTNPQTFFLGQQAGTVVSVSSPQPAYETNSALGIPGQPGYVFFGDNITLTNPLTIYYTLSGSARNGIDYTNLSGTVIIPANQTSEQVYVQPIDPSTLTNPIETVVFTILPNTNYLVDPNNDSQSVLLKSSSTSVSIFPPGGYAIRPIAPGQPAHDQSFVLGRNDDFGYDSSPINVQYEISGTASNGVDYQLLSGSLVFGAGGTDSTNIDIVPLAENPPQGIKTVTLTIISTNGYLADPDKYTQTMDIYDPTNAVAISDAEYAINQNGPPGAPVQDGSFTVTRVDPLNLYPALSVYYSMSGQASNSLDYAFLNGTVDFTNGQSSAIIPIDPINTWTNASKSVIMTLLPRDDYFIDSNNLYVPGVPVSTNFVLNSSTDVGVAKGADAVKPGGTNAAQPGFFQLQRNDSRGYSLALTVQYHLTGSASNGIDFTNLSGTVTFAAGQSATNVYIEPLTSAAYPGDKTVILSIIPGTGYSDTNASSATLLILDDNISFQTVTNVSSATGLEYGPYFTNLLVSANNGLSGSRLDFFALGTNITQSSGVAVTNLTFTNWSRTTGLVDEVYMIIVTNHSSGFTNGDMFFGSDTGIGWLSSNATASNLTWCILTNSAETNALTLRGGLCFDSTGAFSNNIIAVTSSDGSKGVTKGVWEVNAQGHPRLLTNITASLLEGVTVVTADFGPWSTQIITGDEDSTSLYTIDTNGVVSINDSTLLFPGGIHSESITMIPPGQSLYLCDANAGLIVKLPKSYFTNYVGDLLIESGGEADPPAKLFIIHWDTASASFITRRIRYNYGSSGLEHCTFAPIELPAN